MTCRNTLLLFLVLLLPSSCGASTEGFEPDPDDPGWVYWMAARNDWSEAEEWYFRQLVESVKDASEATGVSCEALVAVLDKEASLRHYTCDTKSCSVKTGDGGDAIGIGQIHRSPWQKFYSKELGRAVYLDDLHDNVEVCARILLRGGWTADDPTAQKRAYGYYNTGKSGVINRYARTVYSRVLEVKEF